MADHRRYNLSHYTPALVLLRCPRCGWNRKGLRDELLYCKRCEQARGVLTELRPERRDR